MKPALLIIDMLNDYFREGRLREKRRELVEHINDLTDWARRNGVPVVWARQEFEPDLSDAFLVMKKLNVRITIKGTGGEKILSDINKDTSDYEIVKKRYSAFFETKLVDLIGTLKIDTLILAGINTHSCIRMTAIDAYQRDYEVIIAKEAVDSYNIEHHEVTLAYLAKGIAEILTSEQIKSLVK